MKWWPKTVKCSSNWWGVNCKLTGRWFVWFFMKIWERKKSATKSVPISSTDELLSFTSLWLWHSDQPPTLIIRPRISQLYLLPEVITAFKGKKLQGDENITNYITSRLNTFPLNAFSDCFVQFLEECKKCTANMGDYFEGKWNISVLNSCSYYSIEPWTWCHHMGMVGAFEEEKSLLPLPRLDPRPSTP